MPSASPLPSRATHGEDGGIDACGIMGSNLEQPSALALSIHFLVSIGRSCKGTADDRSSAKTSGENFADFLAGLVTARAPTGGPGAHDLQCREAEARTGIAAKIDVHPALHLSPGA